MAKRNPSKSADGLLSREEAAQYLGVAPQTLAVWATRHTQNLPYIKVGRLVRYRKAELERWLEDRTVRTDP